MRRMIVLLLIFSLLSVLCGCGNDETTMPEAPALRVGYGRVNITPNYSVPLGGYGRTSTRMSQGFLDYLYATCIAVTDENDNTVLIVTADLGSIPNKMLEPLYSLVTVTTGVPAERILVQATHTHSAPDLGSSEPTALQYLQESIDGIAKACADAMADRSPATMYTAEVRPERMNFVRHYTVTDGTVYGDNFGSLGGGTLNGHTSEADNQLQLLLFKREAEDKKDIVSINWQGHPKMASTADTTFGVAHRGQLSSDYISPVRDYVEANTDCLFSFHLGATGNLNTISKIQSEQITEDYKVYGEKLGEYVVEALKNTKPVEGTAIKSVQRTYEAPIDKSEDHLYDEAWSLWSTWSATGRFSATPQIFSPYHAASIIVRHNSKVEKEHLPIRAVSIGSVGFISAPYEMFDTSGMFIKEHSPFETTFVLTCANGSYGYLATEQTFAFNNNTGSYETQNRSLPRGTAEALANNYVEMLKELKN